MPTCIKNCNKTFAEEHQDILDAVCIFSSVSGGFVDKFVRVSESDTQSGYLIDKLSSTSGINLSVESGVSGQQLIASLDLNFLDNRYENQTENILTFGLNAGVHNGHVKYNNISGIQTLLYPNKLPSSSWNIRIPKDFVDGQTQLIIDWFVNDSISGISIFDVKYNSIGSGEIVALPYNNIVSGVCDGTALKLNRTRLDITSGVIFKEDVFTLKLSRLGNSLQDTLDNINILSVGLSYIES